MMDPHLGGLSNQGSGGAPAQVVAEGQAACFQTFEWVHDEIERALS